MLTFRHMNLLIATGNAHKLGEIRAILGPPFNCLTLNQFPGAPEVVEDAGTFAGNATKKAVQLAKWCAEKQIGADFSVVADDSGLEVDALHGAPGVHSARFAALDSGMPGNSPVPENNAKLLRLLKGVPAEHRTARFRCVIALASVPEPGPENASRACYADEVELGTRLFEGVCEGRIIETPRGNGGFGYDPLFVPDGYDQTFGELPDTVKNRLSHRARALAALKEALQH